MSIERIAKKDELKQWDEMVENSPHGTIFHTLNWLKITEKHTNSKLYPIIGLKGTTPIGLFPLFYQKHTLYKSIFSPPPHTGVPYLGPLMIYTPQQKESSKVSTFMKFQKQVDDFIYSTIKPNYVSIKSLPELLDCRPLKWTGYQVEPLYTYIIDLNKGEEYIWGQFERKLRQSINKAKKRGVFIEEGSREEMLKIYDFLVERYKEQGKIVTVPKNYLLDLYNLFYPKNMRISVAKYEGEIVSGVIDLRYKNKIVSWIGNPKTNLRGFCPNDLLTWESIKWGIKHGFKCYEDVGANTPRLDQYKGKYNLYPAIYFSARKYSPFFIKWFESSYTKTKNFKHMHSKLGIRRTKMRGLI